MTYLKRIILIIIAYNYYVSISFWDLAKENIYGIRWGTGTIIDGAWWSWLVLLDWILKYFKNSVFDLLALIVIWVFIYIWWRLVVARWKPEEFKSALMSFVYVIIWIFVVSAAWAIVKVVTWINF